MQSKHCWDCSLSRTSTWSLLGKSQTLVKTENRSAKAKEEEKTKAAPPSFSLNALIAAEYKHALRSLFLLTCSVYDRTTITRNTRQLCTTDSPAACSWTAGVYYIFIPGFISYAARFPEDRPSFGVRKTFCYFCYLIFSTLITLIGGDSFAEYLLTT